MSEWKSETEIFDIDDGQLAVSPQYEYYQGKKTPKGFRWSASWQPKSGANGCTVGGHASDETEARRTAMIAFEHLRAVGELVDYRPPQFETRHEGLRVDMAKLSDHGCRTCTFCGGDVDHHGCLHTVAEIRTALGFLRGIGLEIKR